jgi:hypothetical protein
MIKDWHNDNFRGKQNNQENKNNSLVEIAHVEGINKNPFMEDSSLPMKTRGATIRDENGLNWLFQAGIHAFRSSVYSIRDSARKLQQRDSDRTQRQESRKTTYYVILKIIEYTT